MFTWPSRLYPTCPYHEEGKGSTCGYFWREGLFNCISLDCFLFAWRHLLSKSPWDALSCCPPQPTPPAFSAETVCWCCHLVVFCGSTGGGRKIVFPAVKKIECACLVLSSQKLSLAVKIFGRKAIFSIRSLWNESWPTWVNFAQLSQREACFVRILYVGQSN